MLSVQLDSRDAIEAQVDEDIEGFERYFVNVLKNHPLVGTERAIIKTYLHYKIYTDKGVECEPKTGSGG